MRLHLEQIKPGFDVILIARQPINQAGYADIEQSLKILLEKAGLCQR